MSLCMDCEWWVVSERGGVEVRAPLVCLVRADVVVVTLIWSMEGSIIVSRYSSRIDR